MPRIVVCPLSQVPTTVSVVEDAGGGVGLEGHQAGRHRHPADPLGMAGGHRQRVRTARRPAEGAPGLDAEGVGQGDRVVGERAERAGRVRRGEPGAGTVHRHQPHAQVAGDAVVGVTGPTRVGSTVHEQHRHPVGVAHVVVPEAAAIGQGDDARQGHPRTLPVVRHRLDGRRLSPSQFVIRAGWGRIGGWMRS